MNEVFKTKDSELNEKLSQEGAKLLSIKTVVKNPGIATNRRSVKEYTFVNDESLQKALKKVNGEVEKPVEDSDKKSVKKIDKKKK